MSAQIPAIEKLGKEAKRQHDVEYESVGSLMLGVASKFANKEQRATFEMLDNIDMIVCQNREYETILLSKVKNIIRNIGAELLASSIDERGRNEVYALSKDGVVSELIILTFRDDGGLAITAMSGSIPIDRLEEISKLSPPKR